MCSEQRRSTSTSCRLHVYGRQTNSQPIISMQGRRLEVDWGGHRVPVPVIDTYPLSFYGDGKSVTFGA